VEEDRSARCVLWLKDKPIRNSKVDKRAGKYSEWKINSILDAKIVFSLQGRCRVNYERKGRRKKKKGLGGIGREYTPRATRLTFVAFVKLV
jgi:hypothetical protein